MATDDDYKLRPLAQLPKIQASNKWAQLVVNPLNTKQYFVSDPRGIIYLINQDEHIPAQPLVNINTQQSQRNAPQDKPHLTAFSLHPNFADKGQTGFATLYSAHSEKTNKHSSTQRIQEHNFTLPIAFDAVVTEWQFIVSTSGHYALLKTREVVRVSLPKTQHYINQLSFNPYQKPGDMEFGLLYISLNSPHNLSQYPLYSGVILRINPQQIGAKSSSIPTSNPFLKNHSIRNAIFVLGAQTIRQFIWTDKSHNQILISHHYTHNKQKAQWFSYSYGGEDWRKTPPKHYIYRDLSDIKSTSLVLHHDHHAGDLSNSLFFLRKQKRHWQLKSLSLQPALAFNQTKLAFPMLEWQFNQPTTSKDKFSLHTDTSGEMLLLNSSQGIIHQLHHQPFIAEKPGIYKIKHSSINIALVLAALLLLISCYFLYQSKVQKYLSKTLTRRRYAKITLDEVKVEFNLFKRHQKFSNTLIKLNRIELCQVLLDDRCICTINTELTYGFGYKQEQKLRDIFKKKHSHKMLDNTVRQISLVLEDTKNRSYITCLYLRKGNVRLSQKSYFEVVDELISWCWLIAKEINGQQTDTQTQSHVTPQIDKAPVQLPSNNKRTSLDETVIPQPTHAPEMMSAVNNPSNTPNSKKTDPPLVDTELILALEKLIAFKKHGFLTDEEFSKSKAKLLNDFLE